MNIPSSNNISENNLSKESPRPPRLRGSWAMKEILGRTLLPHHMLSWMGHHRQSHQTTVHKNAQLGLYSRIFPGDFLHYGYFENPEVSTDQLTFYDVQQAQLKYAQELIKLIEYTDKPILDVGSGMGGFLGLLHGSGFDVTGLTPDELQVNHIRRTHENISVLHCRFEDMPVNEYAGAFGTIIHSESIQYMDPLQVFDIVDQTLDSQGTWIVADYFRMGNEKGESSGWLWQDFLQGVNAKGFQITHSRDITAHVLPTLGFAYLLASRIGLPVFDFVQEKMQSKSPKIHYILENILTGTRRALLQNMEVLNPANFARRKRYMLMCLARKNKNETGDSTVFGV